MITSYGRWERVNFLDDMTNLVTSSMLFIVLVLDSVQAGVDSLDIHLLLVLYLHVIHMISLDHLIFGYSSPVVSILICLALVS